jgi:hypothetical protein
MLESESDMELSRSKLFCENLGRLIFVDWNSSNKKEERGLVYDIILKLSLNLSQKEREDLNSQMQEAEKQQEKPPYTILETLVDKNVKKIGDQISVEERQELEKLLTQLSEQSSPLSLDDFINRFGLTNPNSQLIKLLKLIISALPDNLRMALAVKGF